MQSWLQKWQIIFRMTACILYRLVLMFCLWYALKMKKWELLKLLLHMLGVTSKHSENILINCLLCFADSHARTLWTRANPGSQRHTAATKLLPCCWTCCKRQANYALLFLLWITQHYWHFFSFAFPFIQHDAEKY